MISRRRLRVMTAATEPTTRDLGLHFSFDEAQYRLALVHPKKLEADPRLPVDELAARLASRKQPPNSEEVPLPGGSPRGVAVRGGVLYSKTVNILLD